MPENTPGSCPNPEDYVVLLRSTPAKTVCPNFYLLDHARGCNFNCNYCFLRDIEYNRKEARIFDDTDKLYRQLADWLAKDNLETYLANAGNMTDSLSFENERPLWGGLIEFMRENAERKNRPHCLLVVTKAGLLDILGGADILRAGNIELHALTGKAYKDSKELTLTVADTGRGIEAEHLGNIFGRFYRVTNTRGMHPEGSGLV